MIKKLLKYSALLILFMISLIAFTNLGIDLFSYIKEPKEYGICIDTIENNSNTEVRFLNLLEQNYYTIKPKESIQIHSWLASSDWKSSPTLNFQPFFLPISKFGEGSISQASNRSCILSTHAGLFAINLGRHETRIGSDRNANIWIIKIDKTRYDRVMPNSGHWVVPINGYSLVTLDNITQKRKIIIHESTRKSETEPDIEVDFEIRLSSNPALGYKEKKHSYPSYEYEQEQSFIAYPRYLLKYKNNLENNNIKSIPCFMPIKYSQLLTM